MTNRENFSILYRVWISLGTKRTLKVNYCTGCGVFWCAFASFRSIQNWSLQRKFVDISLSGTQMNNTRTGWTERRCVQWVTNLLICQIWVKVLLNHTWRVENMLEVLQSIIKQQCVTLKSFFKPVGTNTCSEKTVQSDMCIPPPTCHKPSASGTMDSSVYIIVLILSFMC